MVSSRERIPNVGTKQFERRYDLDWLRIFATLLVFLFHCSRFFDVMEWHVKNDELDLGITIIQVFLSGFGMPLFFIIAGMGTFYALGFVKGGLFAKDRLVRLVIPLIVGILTHVSIQVYLEQVSRGNFTGSFFEFYPQYFNGLHGYGGNFAWSGFHLWFLLLLSIFTFITLKLFIYLRREENLNKTSMLTEFLIKPGRVFLLAIPLISLELINAFIGDLQFGGWNLFSHFLFYIFGFLFASNNQFKQSIEKNRNIGIIIGTFTGVLLLLVMGIFTDELLDTTFQISDFLFWSLRAINGWCLIIVVTGLASKHLNFNHKSRKFLNEIVMPFYVLHQTIIVIIGFYIVSLELSILIKYLIISSLSFVIVIGLVLIIRKVNALRFLFGMRLKKKFEVRNTGS